MWLLLLDRPRLVDAVYPPLVHVDDEYDVVAEHGNTMHRGHLDDEGE